MSGYLTTHILDTAKGRPAEGVSIDLFRLEGDQRIHIKSVNTNSDGRTDAPILPEDEFQMGIYELVFNAGDYIMHSTDTPRSELFLDLVPIQFKISTVAHFHVPLLLSPFGYSTYRGS
jgi:5-hydroxyisourate hydrolase